MNTRKNKRSLWLTVIVTAVICAFAAQPVLADGIIIPDNPPESRLPPAPRLTVRYHRVTVTIDGPVATTYVDQVFVNESRHTIEGTYIFPLPTDAAVSDFTMTVDGKRMQGELLERDEARAIYEDIVRRQRDPALLEYVGQGIFQARIFPIPAGDERRIEIEYSQVLSSEGGLTHYFYPLDTERFSARAIEEVSIAVEITSRTPLRAIYSPSHAVEISRDGERRAMVGYEATDVLPDRNFELYFSTSADPFEVNVLSYKPEGEDGFFLLLASPEMVARAQEVVARDIVFVLDTSGSMDGDKIRQAKAALTYALSHLNPEDRFNVVDFSTGVRSYAQGLVSAEESAPAIRYVDEKTARGGTDINRALLEALSYFEDATRPQLVIFMTDGLATEGETDSERIIANVDDAASPRTRIFTFGVGYDVNTILLDTIAQSHGGASDYVVPGESIEEKVSAFYAKISTPLLSDPELDFGTLHVEDTYPYPLPDFFLGSQLVMAGRYRKGGTTAVTLSGEINGEPQRYVFGSVRFNSSGGEPFIARLWATRKVGYLLNQIRLHGEDRELVEELVDLSIRYGIITPYTAFLVQEDEVLTDSGREVIAERVLATQAPEASSGAGAVAKSLTSRDLGSAEVVATPEAAEVRHVADRTFVKRDGVWTDTLYDPAEMKAVEIRFGSPAYFDLLTRYPDCGRLLAVGPDVIVVLDGRAYQVVQEGEGEPPAKAPTPVPETTLPPAWPQSPAGMRWHESLLDQLSGLPGL